MSKIVSDVALTNLKGMFRQGASSRNVGNIPTGHFELDFVIHHGVSPSHVDLVNLKGYDPSKTLGIPLGKVIEIFGEEGSGKSSLAYRIVGYAQKLGHKCAWIDTENSYSENLAWINGVDGNSLLYADMCNTENPERMYYAEDVMDAICNLCKSNCKVIVLDSVANLTAKARMEAEAEKFTVGLIARLMSENLGKIVNHAAANGVLVVFINQLREKIGVMWGNPETSPGGRSLKFNASLRLRVGKVARKDADITAIGEDGNPKIIGHKASIRVVKNRFAKPYYDNIHIPIYYEPYFPDPLEVLFDLGRQLKVIKKYKDHFKWENVDEVNREDFQKHIEYNGLMKSLLGSIEQESKNQGVILPPEVMRLREDVIGDKENAMDTELPGSGEDQNSGSGNKIPKRRGRKKST